MCTERSWNNPGLVPAKEGLSASLSAGMYMYTWPVYSEVILEGKGSVFFATATVTQHGD